MYRVAVSIVITFVFFAGIFGSRALASPGMTWAQEKAWLSSNPAVDASSIQHGTNSGSARFKMPNKWWTIQITFTNGMVTEEVLAPENAGGHINTSGGSVVSTVFKTLYSEVAGDYANAASVATVPKYGGGNQQFFAAKGASYAFMLDPYEVVLFRSADLDARIKRARYCSTRAECGD